MTANTSKSNLDWFLAHFREVRPAGHNSWLSMCPSHDDHSPSLSISLDGERILVNCFAGCGHKEVLRAAGLSEQDLFLGERRIAGVTIAQLAAAKGFAVADLSEQGFSETTYKGSPAISIQYLGIDGTASARRFRVALDGDRFRWEKGSNPIPFGLHWLAVARERHELFVVEGETDAVTAWIHGIPCLGLPGANTVKCLHPSHLEGIEVLYVVQESDEGGKTLVRGLKRRLKEIEWYGELRVLVMKRDGQSAKDLNDLYLLTGLDFELALGRLKHLSAPIVLGKGGTASSIGFLGLQDLPDTSSVEWLWEKWIPKGHLTLVVGEPAVGKSLFCAYLIACALGSQVWPGSRGANVDGVVLVDTEQFRSQYRSRLTCFGVGIAAPVVFPYWLGEPSPEWYTPRLPGDLELIVEGLKRFNRSLIVVDSLACAHSLDENKHEIGRVLQDLVGVAAEHNAAVVLVHHLRKRSPGMERQSEVTLDRVRGFSGIGYLCRSVIALEGTSRTGPGTVRHLKSNLGPVCEPLGFVLDGGAFSVVEPILPSGPKKTGDLAEDLLLAELAQAPVARKEIIRIADEQEISPSSVDRARTRLGIETRGGKWHLPAHLRTDHEE